jgi:hypothetical protein
MRQSNGRRTAVGFDAKEAVMAFTPRILRVLPLLLVALALACSHNPRRDQTDESDYIRMLRDEFFKTHPDGQYNHYIAQGEVVRGMDFLEVLASWGNPSKREKPSPNVEYWVYLEEDEDSKDWVQYKFLFKGNVLDNWELVRHVSQGGVDQANNQSSESSVLSKGSGLSGTGSTPKK